MYKVDKKYWVFLFLIDLVGYLLFFWKKFIPMPKYAYKILIIRLDHIGDLFFTTPVFKLLKNKYAAAQIDILCIPEAKEVLQDVGYVTDIHTGHAPWFTKGASYWDLIKLAFKLRKEHYNIVIDFHDDPRNIILANLIGGYSVGYGLRGLGFLLNKEAHYKNIPRQTMYRNLDLLEDMGIETEGAYPEIAVNEKRTIRGDYTVIHACSRRDEKNWLPQYWGEIINNIEGKIILTGSEGDLSDIKRILEFVDDKEKCKIFLGHSLRELYPLMKYAKLMIGIDTFATHLASAMGTRTIALYGPTHHKLWGTIGKNTMLIQGASEGLPTPEKEGDKRCILSIKPKQVIELIWQRGNK